MLEYGQWEEQRWTSVMCIPGQYQSEEYVAAMTADSTVMSCHFVNNVTVTT